jgi:hypothetical protein
MDPSLFPHGAQFDLPPSSGGGMFGNGKFGVGQAIVAALNGYLAGRGNPVGLANMQMMQQMGLRKQQRQQEVEDYNRKRADDRSDFTFEQDYRAAHPAPVSNDTVNDYQFIAQTLGPEAAKQFLQSKTNPIVMTPYGPMPYSGVAGGSQLPTKPVGPLTPIDEGGQTGGGLSGPFPGGY